MDNIPLGPLCREQLDITICVYFDKYNYIFNDPEQDARIMKVTFADNSVLRTSFYYDTARVEKMIGDGYRRMSEALRWISDGAGETVAIDRRIAEWNEQNINMHQPRINSDVVISNLNRADIGACAPRERKPRRNKMSKKTLIISSAVAAVFAAAGVVWFFIIKKR